MTIGYLIIPVSLLSLKLITNSNIGINYLNVGVFFLFFHRLINLNLSEKNILTSEGFIGSLIEAIGIGSTSGPYFFSNIVSISSILFFNSPNSLAIYFAILFLIVYLVIYSLKRALNNKN